MIAYLSGRVIEKQEETLILDVAGIGYEVWCPVQVLGAVREGSEQKMYTAHIVREDSQTLYGFLTIEEKKIFELLLGVSGIGPKNALKIVSKVSGDDIAHALALQDSTVLEALGISKKLADRMVVELKGKNIVQREGGIQGGISQSLGDEIGALVGLGYSAQDARDALRNVRSENTDERIKEALKMLGK